MAVFRDLAPGLEQAARHAPAITLTGPRQSGKTTLSRAVFPEHPYVSLEAPDVRSFAVDDPRGFLAQFPRGAIIDEVQRAPDMPSYLQGLIDADPTPGQWILTGSQNFSLVESVNQSLAGRTAVHHLLPLSRGEAIRFPHCPRSLEGGSAHWRLSPHLRPRPRPQRLDRLLHRHLHRARRANAAQRGRPLGFRQVCAALRGPHRAARQSLVPGR